MYVPGRVLGYFFDKGMLVREQRATMKYNVPDLNPRKIESPKMQTTKEYLEIWKTSKEKWRKFRITQKNSSKIFQARKKNFNEISKLGEHPNENVDK